MSTATSRLFKMLIDEVCFSRVSWTGKCAKGKEPNIAFKKQKNIQKVLLETLQRMDDKYTSNDLHDDIVYKILKFGNWTKKSD